MAAVVVVINILILWAYGNWIAHNILGSARHPIYIGDAVPQPEDSYFVTVAAFRVRRLLGLWLGAHPPLRARM